MRFMRHLLADRLTSGIIVVLTAYVMLLTAFFGSLASVAVAAEGQGFVLCSALADGSSQGPASETAPGRHQHECCVLSCQSGAAPVAIPAAVTVRIDPPVAEVTVTFAEEPRPLGITGPRRLADPRAPPRLSV